MSSHVDELYSYLPDFILNKLADPSWDKSRPLEENGTGAVLFVDISGFTPLSKRLTRKGTIGLEQLSVILNTYFGTMISLINEHGGEVVSFAGDALLAVWNTAGSGVSLDATVQHAAMCGLLLQERLHDQELIQDLKLSLRSAVGAGSYRIAYVGGTAGRWEPILSGDAVEQLGAYGAGARIGKVLLSPQAYACVNDRSTIETAHTGAEAEPERAVGRLDHTSEGVLLEQLLLSPAPWPASGRPAESPIPASAMLPYLPPSLAGAVTAGQGDWSAELRNITVLFIHLPDFHRHAPLERMHRAFVEIQQTVLHQDGVINKASLDDKGIAVIAAMGLPSSSQEGKAARAIQAGLAIHARLMELQIAVSVGISTGTVFCGSIGSTVRREYTMIGDSMNLAARLMQAADGGILCDSSTCQAAGDHIQYRSHGTLVLKGIDEPVALYAPIGLAKAQQRRSAPSLIGRRRETEILQGYIERLLRGMGGTVVLSGEAGMGKSRLLQHIRALAESQGVKLLAGAGDSIERQTPYFPWRQVLHELLGLDRLPEDPAERRLHVRNIVSGLLPDMSHLTPLLQVVLPFDYPDNEWTASMSGRIRADNTQAFFTGLLNRWSEAAGPTLFIIDDAHWIDSASWALLSAVSNKLPHIWLLVAMRPDSGFSSADGQELLQQPYTEVIALQELSEQDIVQLICDRLGVSGLPEEVRDLILAKAEGHPFFSEELAYALRDSGIIEIQDGQCRVAQANLRLEELNFPATIQGIIMSRIDRLPPSEQLVLKVASVIGRIFSYSALNGTLPIEAGTEELTGFLMNLERLNLTLLASPEPDLTYLFKHIITQEVTYNMLLHSQRRQLHRSLAEWVEGHYDDLTPYLGMLAYHWSKAEDHAKAMDYLERAGLQALRTGAYREAVHMFRDLIQATEAQAAPAKLTARRYRYLGEAYMGTGDMNTASEQLAMALTLNGRAPAATPSQFKKHMMKQLALQLLHRSRPSRYIGRLQHQREEIAEQSRCYFRLSEIAFFNNKPFDNLYHSLHGLNLAEDGGPSLELAQITGNMTVTAGIMTLHPLARAYRKQAMQVIGKVDDISARAWVHMDVSLYHIGIGQWKEAGEYAREAMGIYEKIGDRRYWEASSYLYVKVLAYHNADFAASGSLAAAIYESGKQSGNAQAKSWGLLAQAEGLIYSDRIEEAHCLLQEAEALIPSHIGRTEEIRVYSLLALANLKLGRHEEAKAYAAQGLKLAEESAPTTYYSYESYAGLVEVYLELWRKGGAADGQGELEAGLHRSMKVLRSFAKVFPIANPRLCLYTGTVAWHTGKLKPARKAWNKGLAAAVKLEMPYEESLLRRQMEMEKSAPGT